MKKRILSIALVVVMIVAMIPAMLGPTAAVDYYDGYDAAKVTSGAINVDAAVDPDTAYLAGEKIISRLHYDDQNSSGETSSFEGYIAADANGFYIWVKAVDKSLDKTNSLGASGGDKMQFYIRSTAVNSYAIGSFEVDYLGQVLASTRFGAFNKDLITFETVTVTDGWVAELYIPLAAMAEEYADLTVDELNSFAIGVQCNNMNNDGSGAHRAYCYDTAKGGSYYRGMYASHTMGSGDNAGGWQGTMCVPVNLVGIETAVVTDAIVVDGKMDAAYAKSELIGCYDAAGKGENFKAYAAATLQGLYIYADIVDNTLDKASSTAVDKGDKFQPYFQFGNRFANTNWGYIEMDYRTAEECDDGVSSFRYVNKGSGWYNNAPKSEDMLHATTKKYDAEGNAIGWTAEIMIPWVGNSALNGMNDLRTQSVNIGLQVNNYTDAGTQLTYCLSDRMGGNYWYANGGYASGDTYYGPSGHFYFTPLVFNFDEDVPTDVTRWAKYVDAIELDGVKDSKYSALAGEDVDDYVYVCFEGADPNFAKGGYNNEINLGNVYYAFTDTDMYIYVEVIDNTVTTTKTYEYACVYYEQSNHAGKWNLSATGEFNNNGNYEGVSHSYTLYDGTNGDTANLALTYVGTKEAYTGYNVEFKMPLTDAEKAALAAGEAIEIGVGVEINDAGTDGVRKYYGYSVNGGGYWYQNSVNRGVVSMPKVRLDKALTEADFTVASKITGANVALGSSINVNYYATLPADKTDAQMKFTFNGNEYFANAKATATANEYMFVFEGLAPQCLGDNIMAELIVDGAVVATKDTYSVVENLASVKNAENEDLVEALLHYGAAAQQYTSYKTGAYVNAGLEAPAYTTITNGDKVVGAANIDGVKFSAAGVYHANTNKIYAKIAVEDVAALDFITVTINGAEVALEKYADGVYIVYTDDILVTEFDDVYTFEITDGIDSQTLTYSVNAYAKAKLDAANAATAALAAATYAYGASAEAYAA